MRSSNPKLRLCAGVAFALSACALGAQTAGQPGVPDHLIITDYAKSRPYILVLDTPRTQQGDWRESSRLSAYARANPGRYLAFVSEGVLYRIETADQIKRAEALYAPLRALGQAQAALSAQQKPLSEQQKALSAQQQATSDAATKGRIGALQGQLGAEQGAIGHQQGVLGQQQGMLAEKFFYEAEAMIDACLKNGSCRRVEETARR